MRAAPGPLTSGSKARILAVHRGASRAVEEVSWAHAPPGASRETELAIELERVTDILS